MENGFWTREERDELRLAGQTLGATVELHYLHASIEELWRRLELRNKAAEPGNGNMVAIVVKERAQVDALHAKALALGGTDEGAPGVRGKEGPQAFYGAYFRDLDGNKLCAFRIGPAS